MKKLEISYHRYLQKKMQFEEIRWFRAKLAGVVATAAVVVIATALIVNHWYNDFLGIGYNQVTKLKQENSFLQERLRTLNSEMTIVESTLSELHDKGNELRLLVDLPPIDEETKKVGTGGALPRPELSLASDNVSMLLQSSSLLADRLISEAKLQKQNYHEIVQKSDYNRDYFACVPALKPMDGYYSPKGFGMRMHPLLGIFKTHEGLDIINDVGTPVYASGNGVVELAGQASGGYGLMIVINHGYDFQSLYAHLSKVLVKEGQHVRRGDFIGKSGRSGLVTGPHLHYEVSYKGVRQNPMDYFLDDVKPADYRKELTGPR